MQAPRQGNWTCQWHLSCCTHLNTRLFFLLGTPIRTPSFVMRILKQVCLSPVFYRTTSESPLKRTVTMPNLRHWHYCVSVQLVFVFLTMSLWTSQLIGGAIQWFGSAAPSWGCFVWNLPLYKSLLIWVPGRAKLTLFMCKNLHFLHGILLLTFKSRPCTSSVSHGQWPCGHGYRR